jgi:membrane protein DedA with SNARE-associated domain
VQLDEAGLVHLLASYGYPALAVLVSLAAMGVPLPFPVAATFVALGALSARPDGPHFLVLALVATLAASAGHSADYWLGRAGGPLVGRGLQRLQRRSPAETALTRVEQGLLRRANPLILLTRCVVTPLASPVSLLAGAARIPFSTYLALEVVGEAIYSCGYLTLGRLLGPDLAGTPLTFALFLLLIALIVLLPSLLLRLRPSLLRLGPP